MFHVTGSDLVRMSLLERTEMRFKAPCAPGEKRDIRAGEVGLDIGYLAAQVEQDLTLLA